MGFSFELVNRPISEIDALAISRDTWKPGVLQPMASECPVLDADSQKRFGDSSPHQTVGPGFVSSMSLHCYRPKNCDKRFEARIRRPRPRMALRGAKESAWLTARLLESLSMQYRASAHRRSWQLHSSQSTNEVLEYAVFLTGDRVL